MPDRRWAQPLWFGLALVTWSCGTSSAPSGGTSAAGSQSASGAANAGEANGNGSVAGASGATAGAGSSGTQGSAGEQAQAGAGGTPAAGGDAGTAGTVDEGDAGSTCAVCDAYGAATLSGTVTDSNLNAISGITASATNPGVLYLHNDRDQSEFFAVDEQGTLLGTFTLGGAVLDVEDIAVGPCPQGSCVYLADLGDNVTPRQEYQVLRVAEPTVDLNNPGAGKALASELLIFSYPDGTHNAESLLIDHATQNLYVVTKEAAGIPSAVYRLPPAFTGAVADAIKIADLTVPGANDSPATAADAHPCGVAFLLRTNNTLYEFRVAEGEPFETLFTATPSEVPFGDEQQGEAVAYASDGLGYFTTSEGDNPPIHRTQCAP